MATPLVLIACGRRKSGKSSRTKELVNTIVNAEPNRDVYIHDVNAEYTNFYPEPYSDIEDFQEKIKEVSNSLIVYEESTIVFESRSTDKILKNKLVRARHQNNIILLNFHSIRSIPYYIFDLVDYVRIHKTGDSEKLVREKKQNEKFEEAFNIVKNDPFKYKCLLYDVNEATFCELQKLDPKFY